MFYVIYVLALFLLRVSSMKIHPPGGKAGMVQADSMLPVSWTLDPGDPASFALVAESLIGGETRNVGVFDTVSRHAMVKVSFGVGTFQISAVNPTNTSQIFNTSRTFTVTPSTSTIQSDDSSGANPTTDLLSTSDDDSDNPSSSVAGETQPPTAPASASPQSTSPSASTAANMSTNRPYIIGAAVGAAALVLFLLVWFFIRRRRQGLARRTTFHRSRMVRSPHASASPGVRDMEEGNDVGGTPEAISIPYRSNPAHYATTLQPQRYRPERAEPYAFAHP